MLTKGKFLYFFLALVLLGAAACQQDRQEDSAGDELSVPTQAKGDPFSVMAMVHAAGTDPAGGHGAAPPPIPTVKWDGRKKGGPFVYSSIKCVGTAPVNDIATNLTTYGGRIPGSFSPASIRLQPMEFRVTGGDDSGTLEGTISMVACGLSEGYSSRLREKPCAFQSPAFEADCPPGEREWREDSTRDKITFNWSARYNRIPYSNAESPHASESAWVGDFIITGGTGLYQGITGSGSMSGNFLCLSQGGCSEAEYTDGQIVMVGAYKAPKVPTAAAPPPT